MKSVIEKKPCRLCLLPLPLCKSHISSDFLWKHSEVLKDRQSFSVESPTHPWLRIRNQQSGFWERLLCEGCEKILSVWEGEAKKALFDPCSPLSTEPEGKANSTWFTGLKYGSLKLFQISILWRMSIASSLFYEAVELGKHGEIMRKMLLAQDPGPVWQYGCILTQLRTRGKLLRGVFSAPILKRRAGFPSYGFALAGTYWHMMVTSHSPPRGLCALFLQENGDWRVQFEDPMKIDGLKEQLRATPPFEEG